MSGVPRPLPWRASAAPPPSLQRERGQVSLIGHWGETRIKETCPLFRFLFFAFFSALCFAFARPCSAPSF